VPPSLANIYQELISDVPGFVHPAHGYLGAWAKQGVFLLNTTLTVRSGKAGSHQDEGWETFTDEVISTINRRDQPTVFLLWGRHAQSKSRQIDASKHRILSAPHPSPLSANSGFFGCKHFSQTNQWLEKRGVAPIDWKLPVDPHAVVPRPPAPPAGGYQSDDFDDLLSNI